MSNFEIVNTEYGPVRGIHKKSALDIDYICFQSMPYMKAPLGNLRFRDAQLPAKWIHNLDATVDIPSYCAFHIAKNELEGQEDAGIINVFTKNLKPNKLMPVMVWFYGGAFVRGSSKTDIYGPDYLLLKDIVVVSFNYRIGIFGFLSLNDESLGVPGNTGLKDQIFALKWLKRNIQKFGGDPDNVTIFGISAGGISCHLLSLSEQTNNLFKRAIIMSNTAYDSNIFLPRSNNAKFANLLAKRLGWAGRDGDEKSMLEFLESVSSFDLTKETALLLSHDDKFDDGVLLNPFMPTLEPYESENCIISKHQSEAVKNTWTTKIEMLFTGASFEGLWHGNFEVNDHIEYLRKNVKNFLPFLEYYIRDNEYIAKKLGQKIKEFYFGESETLTTHSYYNYINDALYWYPNYQAIKARIRFASANTFVMRFNVNGKLNFFKKHKKCSNYPGACHADDIFYLFKSSLIPVPPKDSKERKVIEKMVAMFTNFASTGDPSCDDIHPTKFTPQIDADKLRCVDITEDVVREIELPVMKNLKFWDSILNEFWCLNAGQTDVRMKSRL